MARMTAFSFPHLFPQFMWEHSGMQRTMLDSRTEVEAVFTGRSGRHWKCLELGTADSLSASSRLSLDLASSESSGVVRRAPHSARIPPSPPVEPPPGPVWSSQDLVDSASIRLFRRSDAQIQARSPWKSP